MKPAAANSNRPLNSPVEEIKTKLPIEEVIGSYIKVDRAGANYKAKCPFHNEKTPSFFISPERGSYYCFGCNAKGDAFTFVEQFEGTDFKGALKILADRAGVVLSYEKPSPEALTRRSEREALYDIMEAACKYYEGEIENGGKPAALDYVKSRGINDETRKSFRIGFAPDTWRGLYDALKADKQAARWNDSLLEKAGLIKRTEKGYYDRFRGRVMFPIFDSSGRVIAFSGRILVDDGKSAKYINSPDTPLYDKSAVLYGIDRAKNEIRLRNFTILVEGQMDLVLSHQAGIKNTVAVSGTALGDGPGEGEGGKSTSQNSGENEQAGVSNLALVRRISTQIIIAFDSDKAGRAATLRAARIAIASGMDVKVAALPDGKDPADIIKENREHWVKALREAKPVTHFLVDAALLETEDKRKLPRVLNDKVLPFVAQFGSSMEQAQAVSYIASRTSIPERAIWDDLGKVKAKIESSKPAASMNSDKIPTPAKPASENSKKPTETNKLDLVSRKLFSILFLEKESELAKHLESEIRRILGADKFKELHSILEPRSKELAFEAEVSFTKETIKGAAAELIRTLETDQIKVQLAEAMGELSKAETGGDTEKVGEILKKCQELNLRLRNIKG